MSQRLKTQPRAGAPPKAKSRWCVREDAMVRQMAPLMWRSGMLKRKVPSTLAEETLALGEAVASAEWLQVFLSDMLEIGSQERSGRKACLPFR